MDKQEFKATTPDFKGKIDVSIWKNVTKDGQLYLTLSIGGLRVNCFKYEPPKQPLTDEVKLSL